MTSRALVYNRGGAVLSEFESDFHRTWKIGSYGECDFDLAITDPKCKLEYLQFGNFLVVKHDKLPAWGGVIEPQREWGYRKVTVHAYSADYQLTKRRPGIGSSRGNPSLNCAGAIVARCLELANAAEDTRVRMREYYQGKGVVYEFNLGNYYDAMVGLQQMTGEEWTVEPSVDDGGRLVFLLTWWDKAGVIRVIRLQEGHNIELTDRPMTDSGPINNDVLVFGEGANIDSRPTVKSLDLTSKATYGLHQGDYPVTDTAFANVQKAAENIILQRRNGTKVFDLIALDVSDTFYNIGLGDTIPLDLYNVGFTNNKLGYTGNVRVKGMEYTDTENTLRLVTEEVL